MNWGRGGTSPMQIQVQQKKEEGEHFVKVRIVVPGKKKQQRIIMKEN